MIGFLLRLIPFAGPIGVLASIVPRLLHLKREKAIHREVGEAFPVQYQSEIDSHTIRTQITAWRLAAGMGLAGSIVCGTQWFINDKWKDHFNIEAQNAERNYEVANNAARAYRTQYEIARNDLMAMKANISAASLKREASIEADVAKKTKARKARAASENKLPPTAIIDPNEWLRVESAGSAGGEPSNLSAPPNP